jgi:hypothetical protein
MTGNRSQKEAMLFRGWAKYECRAEKSRALVCDERAAAVVSVVGWLLGIHASRIYMYETVAKPS